MLQYLILGFFLGALVMFISIGLMYHCEEKKPHNNVHFYVARDKFANILRLFLNKPIRVDEDKFWASCKHGSPITIGPYFENIGLNEADYKDLKWEDEPQEVYLNLKD